MQVAAESEYLVDPGLLLDHVRGNDPLAEHALRDFLRGGFRWYLRRHGSAEQVERQIEDTLDTVMAAARKGTFESTAAMMTFARKALAAAPARDHAPIPVSNQSVRHMKQALSEFVPNEREALLRYVERQGPDRYCEELGFSRLSFSTLLGQLKARLAHLESRSPMRQGLDRLASRTLPKPSVRSAVPLLHAERN